MLTISQNKILQKTGLDPVSSGSGLTILDSKRSSAPALTKRVASKMDTLGAKDDPNKLLKFSR